MPLYQLKLNVIFFLMLYACINSVIMPLVLKRLGNRAMHGGITVAPVCCVGTYIPMYAFE